MPSGLRELLILLVVTISTAAAAMAPFLFADRQFLAHNREATLPWAAYASEEQIDAPRHDVAGDKHIIVLPDQSLTNRAWADGRLPTWNPYNFAGLPHLANPLSGVFYPPNQLHRVLPSPSSFAWLHALHLVFAGCTAFLYFKVLRLSFAAALFGAVAFETAGWISSHAHLVFFVHAFVWLPLIPAGLEGIARGRRWGPIALSCGLGLVALGGFPQLLVITAYFAAIYGAALGVALWLKRRRALKLAGEINTDLSDALGPEGRSPSLLGFLARSCAAGLAGLCLAGPMLIPAAELSAEAGHRGTNAEIMAADALRPAAFLHAPFPELFGLPDGKGTNSSRFLSQWLLTRPGEPILGNNHTERGFDPSWLVLLLAPFGWSLGRWRGVLFLAISAAAIAMALGSGLFRTAFVLPGIDIGSPMRWSALLAFTLPVLAAGGLDALGRNLKDLKAETPPPRGRRRVGLVGLVSVATLFFLAMALPLAAFWLAPESSATRATDFLVARGADAAVGVAELDHNEKRALVTEILEALRTFGGGLMVPALFALGALVWALLLWRSRGARWAPLASLAIALVVTQQLYQHYRVHPLVHDPDFHSATTPELDYLRQNLGSSRIVRVGPGDESFLFPPNSPMEFGLRDLQGFRALTPQSFLEFMRTVAPNPYEVGFPNLPVEALGAPQLDLLGVRYALSTRRLEESPEGITEAGWQRVLPRDGESGGVFVYENPKLRPRAFFPEETLKLDRHRSQDQLASLAEMSHSDQRLGQLAWVDRDGFPKSGQGEVISFHESEAETRITLRDGSRGTLVVSTQFDPGWVALGRRDQDAWEPLEIARANHTLIGIAVPKGTTQIVLRHQPRSLIAGLALAVVGALLLAITTLLRGARRAAPGL